MDISVQERKGALSLIFCLMVPLTVGIGSSLVSGNQMGAFNLLIKPRLSPPGWLFPIVWTLLYIMMGLGSYLIYISSDISRISILKLYGLQLIQNFFWSIIFFNLEYYWIAFGWIVFMMAIILTMIIKTMRISRMGAMMFVPLAAWVGFAAYLNFAIARLN